MEYKINESEYRFMEVLWEIEPIGSMELVKRCEEMLGWKKSTTFTVIKKLTEKKVVENNNAVVRALVKKDEVQRQESRDFLDRKFQGSLPAFVAAFLQDRKLSEEEAVRLQKMIQEAVDTKE